MTDEIAGQDGIPHGVTPTTNRFGEDNKAYSFFDDTTFIEFPHTIIQGKNSFTFMMWIKPTEPVSESNSYFFHGTKTGGNDILFTFKQFQFNNDRTTLTGWDSIVPNQWQHIAVSFNDIRINIYLNGEITQKLSKPSWTANLVSNGFLIGQDQDGIQSGFDAAQAYKGSMSDIRFYDNKLPPDDIWNVYIKEKYQCAFGCSGCNSENLCTACKGDRILENGQCLCPNGSVETLETNCTNQDSTMTQNLLAHFPMNTLNITDVVNNKNAVNHNCSQQPDRFGNEQSAYRIESTTTWITLPSHDIVNGRKTLTLSIWVKKRAPMDTQFHLIHGTTTGNNEILYGGDHMYFNDESLTYVYNLRDSFKEDVWQHLIYVIDLTSFQIYLNGELIETGPKPNFTPSIAANGFIIGQDQDAVNGGFQTNQHFGGDVSDLRIYSHVATKDQARTLYNAIKYECASGCIACQPFSSDCGKCKGNRLLHQGKCLCPQGTQEDFVSENCPNVKTKVEDGLLMYYPFQNNATDVYGGYDGQAFGLIPTTNRLGYPDSAYTFTGSTNSYFKVRGDIATGYITYSYQAWVRYTANDSNNRFLYSTGTTGKLNNMHWGINLSDIYNRAVYYRYPFLHTLLRTTYLNKWIQIIYVLEDNAYKIYINGDMIENFSIVTEAMDIHKDGFIIGQDQDTLGGGFDAGQAWIGDISDVKIYNKAMTKEEIYFAYYAALYPCDFPCSYCVIKNTDCALCRGNRVYDSGKCNCPAKKFEDLESTNCPDCSYKCATCEHNPNKCLTCEDDTNRISTPDCACKDHYFDDGTIVCKICDYNCSTCEDNSSNCTGCQGANRSADFPDCLCNSGYYDDGQENKDCLQCDYKYATCEYETGAAKTCSDSNRSKDNSVVCDCNQGWFDQGSENKVCGQCHPRCLDCTGDSTTCGKCKGLQRDVNTCSCAHGYYDDNTNSDCQQCDPQCDGCTGSANNCDACKDPEMDINATNKCTVCLGDKTIDGNGNCVCAVQGEYELAGNDNCQQCNYKCLNCEISETQCSECSDSNRSKDNQIICDCNQGWFDQGSENKVCGQCHPRCLDCSSNSTNCGTCKGLQRNVTTCECAQGYFDDDTNPDCQECNYVCSSCTGDESSCDICSDENRSTSNSPKCSCDDGWFDQGSSNKVCGKCDNKCSKCSISSDSCDECAGTNRNADKPDCTCVTGFYDDGSVNCQKCNDNCLTCKDDANSCIDCKPGNTNLNDECNCNIGFYGDCTTQCDNKCESCQNQADQCTKCAGLNRNNEDLPDCGCLPTFYDNGVSLDCQPCQVDHCLKCDTSDPTKCIETESQYYWSESQHTVLPCDENCDECMGKVCIACQLPDTRSLPYCQCQSGFYEELITKECLDCNIRCEICSNTSENCIFCKNGLKRTLQQPQCGCEEGYYEISGEIDCKECHFSCKTCSDFNVCIECNNSDFSPPSCESPTRSNSVVIENNNLELVEVSCNFNCATCELSVDNCTSCKIGLNRSQELPSCSCLSGYHDNNSNSDDCYKCNSTCKTCISPTQCLTCDLSKNRDLNPINLKCECLKGYTVDVQNSDNCIQCFQYQGQCFQKCPKNTMQDEKLMQCVEKSYIQMSNSQIIYTCFGVLLLVNISVVLIFKICLGKKILSFKQKNMQLPQKIGDGKNSSDDSQSQKIDII